MSKFLFIISTLILFFSSCMVMENSYSTIPPGIWRGTLELVPKKIVGSKDDEPVKGLVDDKFEEVSEGELPFTFEVIYENETDFYIEIINGEERSRLTDITTWRDKATNNDSILINFPIYGTHIKAAFEDGLIEGKFYDPTRGPNYSIPFRAKHGKDYRFTQLKKEPLFDVSGKWKTTFGVDKEKPYPAIGEFKQNGNKLTGTFRTDTGDYRFLEGSVQANKLYLSVFDGSHAFLFEAKLMEDSSLIGSFRSGNHYKTLWEAERDANFELTNPDSLTFLKEGYETIDFSFENSDGKMISLNDEMYQNKIKIVQIFGTWCPNCRDETLFLTNYLKSNPNEELEIIALAFERHKERDKAMAAIQTYKDEFDIPYEILHAGHSKKSEAAKSLPMLNHILSFPTMIFIDRENKVRRIHTGFSGPATSVYKDFEVAFDQFVNSLLSEET